MFFKFLKVIRFYEYIKDHKNIKCINLNVELYFFVNFIYLTNVENVGSKLSLQGQIFISRSLSL